MINPNLYDIIKRALRFSLTNPQAPTHLEWSAYLKPNAGYTLHWFQNDFKKVLRFSTVDKQATHYGLPLNDFLDPIGAAEAFELLRLEEEMSSV